MALFLRPQVFDFGIRDFTRAGRRLDNSLASRRSRWSRASASCRRCSRRSTQCINQIITARVSPAELIAHRFDTLAEAQQLLDESGPFAQLFVWPPFYVISVLGIIVGMPVATKLRLDSLGDAPTYRNGRY